jgi:hypothetical protein
MGATSEARSAYPSRALEITPRFYNHLFKKSLKKRVIGSRKAIVKRKKTKAHTIIYKALHNKLIFSRLQQQSADRHVTPLGHIILIPFRNIEEVFAAELKTNNNLLRGMG